MRTPEDIIIRPHITEKSNDEISLGKYAFVVNSRATKTEIRHAVEKLFSVKVLHVNTMNYDGKIKKMGVHIGPRPAWKKAIVKIDLDPKVPSYLAKEGKMTASTKKFKTNIEEFGILQ